MAVELSYKINLAVIVFLAGMLLFPKLMSAQEIWLIQFESAAEWEDAGGRRYTTFNTPAGEFNGDLLVGSGNPIDPTGGYISANVGTTANNAPTHKHPGPGWRATIRERETTGHCSVQAKNPARLRLGRRWSAEEISGLPRLCSTTATVSLSLLICEKRMN